MATRPERARKPGGGELHASVSPSSVGDQPTSRDTLGFTPYVQAVAAFLSHPETVPPLTLSVEGAWGSGKSSFMLQLSEELKTKGGITVWFDGWRQNRDEELWAAFALHFTNCLAGSVAPWKKWFFHLILARKRFDWRRGWFALAKFIVLACLFVFISVSITQYWIASQSSIKQLLTLQPKGTGSLNWDELLFRLLLGTGGMAAYVVLGFGVFRKIAAIVGNPLKTELKKYLRKPKYETHATFIETFHKDFAALVRTYAREGKIFVFIDDLDRCEVPKAADLMQALNMLISDSAPVFYVLGLDREKVAAGLAAKYEKLLPYLLTKRSGTANSASIGTEFGYSFLEKFIQIPFMVPQPGEHDIDKLLESLGSGIENQDEEERPEQAVDAGLLVELSSDSESVREVVKADANKRKPSLRCSPSATLRRRPAQPELGPEPSFAG